MGDMSHPWDITKHRPYHAFNHIVKKGKVRPRNHPATTLDGCLVVPWSNHPPWVVAQGGATDIVASQKK